MTGRLLPVPAFRRVLAAFAALVLAVIPRETPRAQELVADLSDHLIAITSGFTGATVLLFGAVEAGGDVVVTVRGPEHDTVVRRKDRVAGIWLNAASVRLQRVPGYYAVLSNRSLGELLPPSTRRLEQIGVDALQLEPADPAEAAQAPEFRAAFLEERRRAGLYAEPQSPIDLLGRKLFRATLRFPSNVPVGTYLVTVYLVRDQAIVAAQTTPLSISQTGIGAEIHDFALREALMFGVFAVAASAMAGWGASLMFRRV